MLCFAGAFPAKLGGSFAHSPAVLAGKVHLLVLTKKSFYVASQVSTNIVAAYDGTLSVKCNVLAVL
ncbi:hypothetical protein GCHA_1684 [Paraglaciecola chathamensis S18K6]|uniref:Uncharacterized protein n=1 Tax=Paraglaciecola chathamensis S18K6 TaxID=1127672 RepID=A0AAV3UX17_9ALTE|nr:hypothetical protein GCHA_1684 [Paraglaciecola chathamensis S18K6]